MKRLNFTTLSFKYRDIRECYNGAFIYVFTAVLVVLYVVRTPESVRFDGKFPPDGKHVRSIQTLYICLLCDYHLLKQFIINFLSDPYS